jgi:pSer/pThr/pTyr-binding forkhead associated (FHA) protein
MKAKLIAINGGVQSCEINLEQPVMLGRGRKANIMLPHSLVSRQHCELLEIDGQLMVRDLGSMNGTLVNRRQISQPTPVHTGDLLTVGPVTFRIEYLDACATKSDTNDETAVTSQTEPGPLTDPAFGPESTMNQRIAPLEIPAAVKGTEVAGEAPAIPGDDLDEFSRNLK